MVDDVAPKQVWEALGSHPAAKLVDVRTDVEWATIGVPDLAASASNRCWCPGRSRPPCRSTAASWTQMRAAGVGAGRPRLLPVPQRRALGGGGPGGAAAGFSHAYNIADGFEGPPDGTGTRGRVAGWQADGLPWKQS